MNRKLFISVFPRVLFGLMITSILFITLGCSDYSRSHVQSSVFSYLYPKETKKAFQMPTTTTIVIPARVGIAWAPSGALWATPLDPVMRQKLLERVKKAFEGRPFVESIKVIPNSYFFPKGSFDNLDQIKSTFGVDIICLVGYDQVQESKSNSLSFLYLTVVGAFVVPAEKNTTQTMLDGVVIDIASHRLLFRAPGMSTVTHRATLVHEMNYEDEYSREGLNKAADMMIKNLGKELDAFKARIKNKELNEEEDIHVVNRGGGELFAWNWPEALLTLLLVLGMGWGLMKRV